MEVYYPCSCSPNTYVIAIKLQLLAKNISNDIGVGLT